MIICVGPILVILIESHIVCVTHHAIITAIVVLSQLFLQSEAHLISAFFVAVMVLICRLLTLHSPLSSSILNFICKIGLEEGFIGRNCGLSKLYKLS